jgi:hypothetical protein
MGRVCSMGGREETPNDIAFLEIYVHAEWHVQSLSLGTFSQGQLQSWRLPKAGAPLFLPHCYNWQWTVPLLTYSSIKWARHIISGICLRCTQLPILLCTVCRYVLIFSWLYLLWRRTNIRSSFVFALTGNE